MTTEIQRALDQLYPPFAADIDKLISQCKKQGLAVEIFEGYRSFDRQQELYSQGRFGSKKKIVTNAGPGLSAHNYGLGVDLVFDGDTIKPGIQWSWSGDYASVGKVINSKFKSLEWAGNWKRFPEYPHVQNLYGYSVHQLKAIYDTSKDPKKSLAKVWATIQSTHPVA